MRPVIALAFCLLLAVPAMAGEVTYREHIRPLWEARCAGCHGADSPYLGDYEAAADRYQSLAKGPRMDTYADLLFFAAWPDSGALMRRLDDGQSTRDGKPGNMHVHLGASDEERQRNLALFKAWIGEGGWVLKKADAITKEELERIVAPY